MKNISNCSEEWRKQSVNKDFIDNTREHDEILLIVKSTNRAAVSGHVHT